MNRDLSRGRHVVGDGKQAESPASEKIARVKRGRGREGEPLKWTGAVHRPKRVTRANPGHSSVTAVPSRRKRTEVIGLQPAEKSLYPDSSLPVPQTDTGRQGELSSGERVTLCQGTRQIDPVPLEEGGP